MKLVLFAYIYQTGGSNPCNFQIIFTSYSKCLSLQSVSSSDLRILFSPGTRKLEPFDVVLTLLFLGIGKILIIH